MHTAQLQMFGFFGIPPESNYGMPATQQRSAADSMYRFAPVRKMRIVRVTL